MSIGFLIRKTLVPLLFPLPVCLELLIVGLLLLWFTRRQRAGKCLVTAGTAALVAFSCGPVARLLMAPLESRYQAVGAPMPVSSSTENRPRWIVILGGGHIPDERLPVTSQLSSESLARLVEGIRLYKQRPGGKVIVSGGRDFNTGPEAEPIAHVAEMLGVSQADLVIEDESLDTEDQASRVGPLVAGHEFFLVTSASHMPRALALFRKRGMRPIPAPADYDLKGVAGFAPGQLYPHAENIRRTEKAVYEYLGLTWGRLRGAL